MNTRTSSKFFAAILAAATLAACSTSTMSRIDSNRAAYESWPLEVQQAVLNGRAEKGMTPEMVRMAVGEPTKIETRDGKGGEEEVWIYSKGGGASSLLNNASISTGTSIGGIGISGPAVPLGGGGNSAAEEETDVIFQNGVVTSTHQL